MINTEFASVILNVKFVTAASKPGTTGYVSSENLFKPSKRNLRANSSGCLQSGWNRSYRKQQPIFRTCIKQSVRS